MQPFLSLRWTLVSLRFLGHRDLARRYVESLRSRQQSTDPGQFWDEVEIRLLGSEAEATILHDPIFPAENRSG